MTNVEEIFRKIDIKAHNCIEGPRYLDPSRANFLVITPEETVRQKTLVYLQTAINVPLRNIFTEDHLRHYGVSDINGRIDISLVSDDGKPIAVIECKEPKVPIVGFQVYEQAVKYASAIGAPYIILTNSIYMLAFHLDKKGYYQEIETNVAWDKMLKGLYQVKNVFQEFARLEYKKYYDIDFIKSQEWSYLIIGDDTNDRLVPVIVNLSDCLLDYKSKMPRTKKGNLELVEDLGVQYRVYNDASGGGFGTGEYRTFLMKDVVRNSFFMIGFALLTTGKTTNDPKYGNRQGMSVLVIFRNDGNKDEMSVQINLNKFLRLNGTRAVLTHNDAVTRKGARKEEALNYISAKNDSLVVDGRIYIGEFDTSKPISFDDVKTREIFWRLIEYSIYRDEYKEKLSKANRCK